MAFKGESHLRQHIQKMNDASNFPAELPYQHTAGVPKGAAAGTYDDKAKAAQPKDAGAPLNQPSPFSFKK